MLSDIAAVGPYAIALLAGMLTVQLRVAVVPVTVALIGPRLNTGVNARVTLLDLPGSCLLVAVSVADVPVIGAVKAPAGVIVPAEADQV